ncbi:MAG: FtsX-like permease family protein [Candidatus Cloacimonetes bacterium]|jgi:putative ABC transport system permease protein|nr:FtsX-like permease family protein [Candidatus Cloacimonadota bacterium]
MIFKLALKNILGAGFRTWLNIFILSLSYFAIIALQGFYVGWQDDAEREIKNWDIAGGQYWHETYDPYDPYALEDSHAPIPEKLKTMISEGDAISLLFTPATIYPEGRMRNIILKGIDPDQTLIELPTKYLTDSENEISCIIGSGFADNLNIKEGDFIVLRWRDKNGAFDARDVKVAHVFSTTVLNVEKGQIWISLPILQEMLGLPDEATIITVKDEMFNKEFSGWLHKDLDFLLLDLTNMIHMKTVGSSIMYAILLFLAMIAIFDTQILAIFRRRKEMGTMMAMGMTRPKIIQLFTMEGVLHAVLAIFIGAIYGIPLLRHFEKVGMQLGADAKEWGLSGLDDALYPVYGWKLVVGTIILVLITTTIVSFLPTRKIAKLKPTDALRGKMTK